MVASRSSDGAGGIYDQLGGGFAATASTRVAIPHFEKMLYDNGPLLALYADLARVDGRHAVRGRRARPSSRGDPANARCRTGVFLEPRCGQRGEEGKFYVWSADEGARCSRRSSPRSSPALRLDGPPNFEGPSLEPSA
jgi:uncharacterized protein YyaL (SSP411 family)